jgi:adenylate cyclase
VASVRRLSAIMFTDMVGSTAAAQADEARALKLREEQAGLVRSLFATHQGHEIKSMGDGFLAEFDSALRAVQCAIDIQQHLHERNAQPGASPILLRIGVHLGDVEQRESDIFGDAVNIASRIEPTAPPGGVCISGQVFDQVRNKIPNQLEKLPSTPLKGLDVQVDIYRVGLPWNLPGTPSTGGGPTRIAVLPFTNMSPDPADLYFADGLTEELITVLSQLRELRVIARTSVMQYKSTTKEVSQIGANLGVSSILEGSVRRAGNRLRITAQLIDVHSQEHVWAKSYDRELDDVFVVQSEVAKQVASALKIELRPSETARLESRPAVRPDSYLAYLKGRSLLQSDWSEKVFRDAKEQFELALSLDPTNARAHSGLADALVHLKWGRYEKRVRELDQAVRDNAARALALDPALAEAHCSMGNVVWDERKNLEAEKEFRLAISLNPSYATAHFSLCQLLLTFARTDEALQELVLAEELDPTSVFYASWRCSLLFFLRRLDEDAVRLERLRAMDRDGRSYHGNLGFYYFARSEFDQAFKQADRLDAIEPGEGTNLRVWANVAIGRKDEAWRLIKQEEAQPEKQSLDQLAQWHVAVGDLDGCFQYLDAALDRNQLPIQIWRIEPKFEPVRMDPRFGDVLNKLNLSPVIT